MENDESVVINYTSVLGRVVAALRAETELNQIDFAAACRMKQSTLARIESGKNTATIDHIMRIERAFNKLDKLDDPGDLVLLVYECCRQLVKRGVKVRAGKLKGEQPVMPQNRLDAVASMVVLEWEKSEDDEIDFFTESIEDEP